MSWTKIYLENIAFCRKHNKYLTDWEKLFLNDIEANLAQERTLTRKQQDTISRIYDSVMRRVA
jgi:hypothetical protein